MTDPSIESEEDEAQEIYEEREAVAIFNDETALNSAVDELMRIGIREEDLSLLADTGSLSREGVASIEDKDFVAHADYVSPDSRTEGMAALVGVPLYVAGAGVAAVVATGGAALIPTVAIVAGSGLAASAVGLILARVFGHQHARHVQQQIARGGMLLWVRVIDESRDSSVLDTLRNSGGRDVHLHVVRRSWSPADVPLSDAQPDPLLKL